MKKLQVSLLIAICAAIATSTAFAEGGGVSGGGNVVACERRQESGGQITISNHYTLLDYHDAVERYHFNLDLGPGKTYLEKINYVLERLAKVDRYRASLYKYFADRFIEEIDFTPSNRRYATDSGDIGSGYFLDEGCDIRRVVIQRSDDELMLTPGAKKYEISQKIWASFDEETKAGMMLHEISYREAIARGAKNSLAIRRYVGLISSQEVLKNEYSLEILRAGLVYWGDKKQSTDNWSNELSGQEAPREGAANFISFVGSDTGRAVITEGTLGWALSAGFYLGLERGSQNIDNVMSKVQIHIATRTLSCKSFLFVSKYGNRAELAKSYKEAIGAGIDIKNLAEGTKMYLSGCGQWSINSDMFANPSAKFDLIVDTDRPLYTSPVGGISRDGFSSFFVIRGTINGQDVSNQGCTVNHDRVHCSVQDHLGSSF